ncbi:MAG: peptidase [Spirulinaceae cyanobacterium SM2_1_0]|nr:peptidase [Spirulinaceae cyanobacterium SM2_1_0]
MVSGARWWCWLGFALSSAILTVAMLGGLPGRTSLAATEELPALQAHPLPATLSSGEDVAAGDYFDRVQPTVAGYLLWSSFPVKVYLEPEPGDRPVAAWSIAIRQAIQDWSVYLPLVEVSRPENADILWQRQAPPFRVRLDRERREFIFPGSRTAETRFELYWQAGTPPRLAHRCTILLTPNQRDRQTLGTARHELGHALGIWGHSPEPTDVLYASQVREPPPISARDRNTLRKVYEQPTRLGWPAPRAVSPK